MPFIYRAKHLNQLHSWYAQRVTKKNIGFTSFDTFLAWYDNQEKVCHYCKLSEVDCQEISIRGLLKSKRFPKNGIPGQGTSRGVWLEIDRVNPYLAYTEENCVLCCYFCNNDKSDVFHGDQYIEFIRDRKGFLMKLLNQNKIND